MNIHQDDQVSAFFNCHSQFTPYREPEPEGLADVEPEIYKQERKKAKGIQYLPGEKLLIKLAKENKKKNAKAKKKVVERKVLRSDIDRISESMSRVLSGI